MTDRGLTTTDSDANEQSDLAVLVRARRRLRELVVQLEVAPFAEQTAESMRAYLDEDATEASFAFARWRRLPEQNRTGQVGQALRGQA
ncbi:hypothetical protein EDD95_8059 [Streptomyces sp. CEV 2-1]|uniref:hypothetical protein n=1 Tax=Streptomyces sp. CEV 2-1 TaxID=2485153 RepID=UPI000FC26016|nr:hypothetical protein [Streptomyces sp. CEV 2-1]ROQ65205.1 hypothetical protein EDD95_8059 [Streptomyces sp. CEV 2-1]